MSRTSLGERRRRDAPGGRRGSRRDFDRGQAMMIVIALMAVLVAVPAVIMVLAVGGTQTSENAALVIQAKQAAVAGISDYINHVQAAPTTYPAFCSNQLTTKWTCPAGTSADSNNPAFVNTVTTGNQWITTGVTMPGASNGNASFRYVVDSPNSNPTLVTIYSIGQAGTATGQHVSATEEAALTVCANGCLYPTTGVSCIKVPANAVSAKIIAYGAKGGGGGPDASGGVGALVTATVPVTGLDILDLYPGQPGQAGVPVLLNVLNLFSSAGGAGGVPLSGACRLAQAYSPPDLGGGNGAIPGGLADVATTGGGGGGGATMVFDATSNNMVAVAGGGGGGGAGNLLAFLGGPPGAGGSGGSPPGSGGTAAGLLFVIPGAPGGAGGTWLSGGPTPCASTTTPGATGTAPGNACGQNGYLPPALLGVSTGGGGGGGGGFTSSTPLVGGGGGGTTGGLLGLIGSGGGGGAGASYANHGACAAPSIGPATTYPTGDTNNAGQISITFYAGACGTTPLTTVTGTIRAASAP